MNRSSPPPISDMLAPLEAMTGMIDIQVDVPLKELGIDSIDVLEWVFMIEDRLGFDADDLMADFGDVRSFGDLTLRLLYDALVSIGSSDSQPEPA
jgi:acyl carrier protein